MRFAVRAPQAQSIALAGDFNGWRHDQLHMRPSEADGVWTVIVPLRPGRYQYMFVVDGNKWLTDPLADGHYDDGFGNRNAVVEVRPERRKAI
jgi:1,4-alpha-glucan branching enzyme